MSHQERYREEVERQRREQAKEVSDKIMQMVNGMRVSPKHIAEAMSYDHRTLQQCFTGICVAWFKKLAEMERTGNYDLRNEASVKLAKKLEHELADVEGLPFI